MDFEKLTLDSSIDTGALARAFSEQAQQNQNISTGSYLWHMFSSNFRILLAANGPL